MFANPSGSRSAKLHAGPVRVREDGRWRPLDVRLGSQGAKVRPRAVTADVAFSDGGDRSLARLDGERGALSLTWKGGRLPEPELNGAKATYRGVESGVDIDLEARPQGFDEKVVVSGAPSKPLVLRFGLSLRGLRQSSPQTAGSSFGGGRGRQVALADPARSSARRSVDARGSRSSKPRSPPVSYNGRNLHRSLVRFPRRAGGGAYGLGAIPKGSRVTSAAMHLYNPGRGRPSRR